MNKLLATKGLTPGRVFPLEKDTIVLGRHPECDIVVDLGAISRQHARILWIEGASYVEDLNSRNGTFVNEQRIEGRQKLKQGDELRICDVTFEFVEDATVSTGLTERAILVDDERATGGSTIMSKLDVSTGSSGLRLTVNAEAKLKALLEIGRNLGRAIDLDQVLAKLLDNLFSIFLQADRGFIVLKDRTGSRLIPKAVKHRRGDPDAPVRISRTIVNGVIASKEAILSADAATDSRFDMAQSIVDFQIHSMMCVPLVGADEVVLGVLQIDSVDPRHRFTRDDLEVLASVAGQAAVAVENAQLHEVAMQEQLLRTELNQAHRVQRAFLPAAAPRVAGYEFFHFYEPATHLGGDYFDYIPLTGGRLAVALGDVSGKGAPAALLMAKLSAEARYCLVMEPTPADAVFKLNNVFCDSSWEGRFITLLLAVIDPSRHEVTMVNAGHLAPMIRRAPGKVEEVGVGEGRLPLGVDNDTNYHEFTVSLAPGESLTVFTDGVSEAMNASNDLYGIRRLQNAVAQASPGASALGQHILGDVRRFVGARAQTDDICMVCFGRTAT